MTTTTEATANTFQVQAIVIRDWQLHIHVKNTPGRVHLCHAVQVFIKNRPEEPLLTSYCGRLKQVQSIPCEREHHGQMVLCKDCLKRHPQETKDPTP